MTRTRGGTAVPEPRQPDVRTIIDGAIDAVVTMDEQGRVTEWSRSAEELFGWSRDEVLGARLSELIVPPQLRSAHEAGVERFRSTGQGPVLNQILQLSAVNRAGDEFPIELAVSRAMVSEAGTTFIGFIRDISARQLAEERARRTTDLIRLLGRVASAANSAATVEEAASVILRETCDLAGWVVAHAIFPEGATGTGVQAVWYLEDEGRFGPFRDRTEEIHEVVVSSGIPGQVLASALPEWRADLTAEPRFPRLAVAAQAGLRGGYWFPVLVGDRPVGVLEFFSTEGAEPDDDLRDLMRALGSALGRVFERQRGVHRLEEALRSAQAASDAKSHYLGRISHELRTPLTAILGYGELLELDDPRPDQAQPLAVIKQAGQHLLDLVNEVLDIARIEAGREEFLLEPVSLGEVVGGCLALLQPKADERGVHLQVDAAALAQGVRADRQRLAQVVVNLLSNAVKYNHDGGQVFVTAHPVGGDLVLSIRDTGPGISAADLPRLFDPFDRLDADRRGIEGTGLGLTLSRRLVEGMGGRISVTSRVGEGTLLEVALPAARRGALPLPDAPAVAPSGEEGSGRAHRILYVEDNPTTFSMMERLFARRPQVTVITAMQGSLAIELAREHQPELVILDLHLPDMDGADVLDRLRSHPRTAGIPVVMLTADATERQRERLLRAGAHAYLTKPVRVRELLALVDGVLDPPGTVTHPAAAGGGER